MGNMKAPIGGAVLLLTACLSTVQGLVCLNCPDVAHPRLCKHVTTCSVGEKCGIETFVSNDGDLLYKLGCVGTNYCSAAPSVKSQDGNRGNQFVACHSCCDKNDLCNDVGCNSTGFPATRGPICYNCEALPRNYSCHKIDHCETHEVCFNDATLEFQTDMMYSSGCRSKHNCADNIIDPVVLLGKRHVTDDVYSDNKRSVSVCTSCCARDLCNVPCKGTGQYSPPTTMPTTMPTTLPTTKPTTLSTDTTATTTMTMIPTTHKISFLQPFVEMRVERGPDWHWLNQDGNGPGTVTDVSEAGWVKVKWNNNGNENSYRYGDNNTYDVQPIRGTATASTTATTASTAETVTARMPILQVNDTVVRGTDWMWPDQDGNGTGTVIDVPMVGWVNVKWDKTGIMNSYRYGVDNKHDVQLISSTTTTTATTTRTTINTTTATTTGITTNTKTATTTNTTTATTTGITTNTTTATTTGITINTTTGTTTETTTNTTTATTTGITTNTTTGTTTETTTITVIATSTETTATTTDAFKVGDVVVRGADWRYGSQDKDSNGVSQVGVVVGVPPQTPPQWVEVEWPGGYSNTYRVGFGGKWDIRAA